MATRNYEARSRSVILPSKLLATYISSGVGINANSLELFSLVIIASSNVIIAY